MEFAQEIRADSGIASSLSDIHQEMGKDYWSFEGRIRRSGAHSLISYPAMMVPSLQGHLIDIIRNEIAVNHILDPFVGSGTVLTEAMSRNISFTGIDINPLAILACRVKSGCYFVSALQGKYIDLCDRIKTKKHAKCREFPGVEKWFHPQTAIELEGLAQAIREETSLWARRVFWLAMGRTVRQTSNSRLSTYKLHKREQDELGQYRNAQQEFIEQCAVVINSIEEQYDHHKNAQVVKRGRYKGEVNTFIGDAKTILTPNGQLFDLVMTSPPYGDNQTTIPYGQFSYLPLHWIDLEDIDPQLNNSVIKNTAAIDNKSLGGSLRYALKKSEFLADNYNTVKSLMETLEDNLNGLKRFAAFFFDLEATVDQLCDSTAVGGCHSWTVGNRRINNQLIPMNEILIEMLEARGMYVVATINREIKHKKMASRNNIADTMKRETIVIAQKAVTDG